jgi:hypothetical protein
MGIPIFLVIPVFSEIYLALQIQYFFCRRLSINSLSARLTVSRLVLKTLNFMADFKSLSSKARFVGMASSLV